LCEKYVKKILKAIRSLIATPRIVLPSGKHYRVCLPLKCKESWMIHNPQKNPDRHQNLITSLMGHAQLHQKTFTKIRLQL